MRIDYSFLTDELALVEIRKHKWIESEKLGQEIGFATAAHDWINKYGYTWKQFRLDAETPDNVFCERRRHRRFAFKFPFRIKIADQSFVGSTNDVSLIGLSCTVPIFVPENSLAEITINLSEQADPSQKQYHFSSRILRITRPASKRSLCYEAFMPFTEQIRDYLRLHADFFKQSFSLAI